MLPGSVHFSPYFSTAARGTGMNVVWFNCWTNHAWGAINVTLIVVLFSPDGDLRAQGRAVLLAAVVRLGSLDAEELVGVVARELRRDRPQPGPDVVLGGHLLPGRPAEVVAELDRNDRPLHGPALGGRGNRLQLRRRAERDERLVEGLDDVGRGCVGGEAGVERRRVSENQNPQVLPSDPSAGRRADHDNGDGREGSRPQGPSHSLSHTFLLEVSPLSRPCIPGARLVILTIVGSVTSHFEDDVARPDRVVT